MKKYIGVVVLAIVVTILYFIGKAKGWWSVASSSTTTKENKFTSSLKKVTDLTTKKRNLDAPNDDTINTTNQYGVNTAIVVDDWNGRSVYGQKDGKSAQEFVSHPMAIGFLENGEIVFKYKIYDDWVFDTKPFSASYMYNYNEYGVDTNTVLAVYAGNDIYAYKMDTNKTTEYGYLYDGTPVYKQGNYYQW
ncbi:hypothetical protein [Flectobacillus major]|uniref:hypothetical protein n=1 Tax=Flectobacillus major TaxID=103 RepID=UPI0005C729AF|nr:hypothetical protein [Flectobacillus major]